MPGIDILRIQLEHAYRIPTTINAFAHGKKEKTMRLTSKAPTCLRWFTLDALTTVNNAQREAYGYQVQGMNAQAQGAAAQSAAKSSMTSTLLTAPLKAYGAYQMGGGTWSPFSQKAAPISAAVGTPTGR